MKHLDKNLADTKTVERTMKAMHVAFKGWRASATGLAGPRRAAASLDMIDPGVISPHGGELLSRRKGQKQKMTYRLVPLLYPSLSRHNQTCRLIRDKEEKKIRRSGAKKGNPPEGPHVGVAKGEGENDEARRAAYLGTRSR